MRFLRRVTAKATPTVGIWCDWPNEHPTKYDWAEDGFGMTEAEARAVAKRERRTRRASTPRRFSVGTSDSRRRRRRREK